MAQTVTKIANQLPTGLTSIEYRLFSPAYALVVDWAALPATEIVAGGGSYLFAVPQPANYSSGFLVTRAPTGGVYPPAPAGDAQYESYPDEIIFPPALATGLPPPTAPPGALTSVSSALSLSAGPPTFGFTADGGFVLAAGATELMCVPVTLTERASGTASPADMSTLFAAGAVTLALSRGTPVAADFRRAEALVVGGVVYACLLLGPGGLALPFTGYGRVYVRIVAGSQVLVARAMGLILLRA